MKEHRDISREAANSGQMRTGLANEFGNVFPDAAKRGHIRPPAFQDLSACCHALPSTVGSVTRFFWMPPNAAKRRQRYYDISLDAAKPGQTRPRPEWWGRCLVDGGRNLSRRGLFRAVKKMEAM